MILQNKEKLTQTCPNFYMAENIQVSIASYCYIIWQAWDGRNMVNICYACHLECLTKISWLISSIYSCFSPQSYSVCVTLTAFSGGIYLHYNGGCCC